MQKLLIYRSSAGSGKTYTLVKTYLTLLFQIPSDSGFQQILAITFTNKAAAEMKKRVLDALEEISVQESSNKLAIEIAKENNLEINLLVKRAKSISQKILHNYKDFNLMTIDKFTNRVIRSFSKELGISNSYNIILEENEFIEEVISEYIDEVSKNKNQLEILENVIDQSIQLGLKNNIERQLNKFKNIIFKSDYSFQNPMKTEEIHELRNYIYNELKTKENKIKEIGISGISLLNEYEILDSWMSYGRVKTIFNTFKLLPKLSHKELEKWNNWIDKDQWFKKTLKKEEQLKVGIVKNEILNKINTLIKEVTNWIKLLEVHKFIIPFSMVQSLMERIIKEKSIQNSILISDFNDLVSDIIKNEPAGFIFEKIGSRYKYVLIDEFQDTSSLQWNNLIPLVHESLSVGGQNLIVGDAKQAIYRWRNGNVNQFINLPNIVDPSLQPNYESLFKTSYKEKSLENNWRSSFNIVDFNNWIFQEIVKINDYENIHNAYHGLSQNNQRNYLGLVDIKVSEKSNFSLTSFLKINISNAESKGYQLKDICILVRSKKDGLSVVNSLLDLDKSFVSEDCLFLNSSIPYRILHSFLRYLESKEERDLRILDHFLNIHLISEPQLLKSVNENLKNIDFQKYLNLYDFQKLSYAINFLHININDPFVDFFINLSNQLILSENFNMFELLKYFDEKSKKLTVENTPKNAIQILTIHKSKGLEFPVVMIPFTNWDSKNNLDAPYTWIQDISLEDRKLDFFIGEMSSKSLLNLGKEKIYKKEQEEVLLDNLNLYYVAFTRAIDQLYISFIDIEKKNDLPNQFVSCIKSHERYSPEINALILNDSKEMASVDIIKKVNNKEIFHLSKSSLLSKSLSIDKNINFPTQLNFGTFFHDVISKVYSDFSDAYDYLEEKKNFSNWDESYISKSKEYLEKIESNQSLNFIFDTNQLIYNEKEIKSKDNVILRLDRLIINGDKAIIVDYKTSEGKDDINQVRNYINNINLCGYKNVSAFLLYVNTQNLIEVTF
jgi:ATP-dependent exoDNAse (exonuclease V) beta subunit